MALCPFSNFFSRSLFVSPNGISLCSVFSSLFAATCTHTHLLSSPSVFVAVHSFFHSPTRTQHLPTSFCFFLRISVCDYDFFPSSPFAPKGDFQFSHFGFCFRFIAFIALARFHPFALLPLFLPATHTLTHAQPVINTSLFLSPGILSLTLNSAKLRPGPCSFSSSNSFNHNKLCVNTHTHTPSSEQICAFSVLCL